MSKAIITEQHLHDIADAIIAKGGATAPMTPAQMPSKIAAIPTGRPIEEASIKCVCFYDYDGFRLYSFTKEEVLAMTELPPFPHRDGYVYTNWTHTLEEVKAVREMLDVGAIIKPDDDSTRFLVDIPENGTKRMCVECSASQANDSTIDWGDGTVETVTISPSRFVHDYVTQGKFVISIRSVSGYVVFTSDNINCEFAPSGYQGFDFNVTEVNFGPNVRIAGRVLLYNVIPVVTFAEGMSDITKDVFYSSCVRSLIFPRSVTKMNSRLDSNAYLKTVVFPPTVTEVGGNAPSGCKELKSYILPDGVTSVGLPSSSSLIRCQISPDATSIQDVSLYQTRIISFTIPDGITSIGAGTLRQCELLTSIRMPPNLASIGNYCFQVSRRCVLFDFRRATLIPTLSATSTFTNLPSDCKIVVPDALYDDWIVATNWSAASIVGHIVKASEYTEA